MGGWVVVDGIRQLTGPLYLRFRRAADGRLQISEMYLDASQSEGASIASSDVRELPLSQMEAFANVHADKVMRHANKPAPDLSTLASYFDTRLNTATWADPRDKPSWAVLALASQVPELVRGEVDGPEVIPAERKLPGRWHVADDRDYMLMSGPTDGLTDEFLRNVARAYAAAVARGERPNKAIAEQTGYDIKSAQRWVYTARQRGIMPRGRQGRVG